MWASDYEERNNNTPPHQGFVMFLFQTLLSLLMTWYANRTVTKSPIWAMMCLMGASLSATSWISAWASGPFIVGAFAWFAASYWWEMNTVDLNPPRANKKKLHTAPSTTSSSKKWLSSGRSSSGGSSFSQRSFSNALMPKQGVKEPQTIPERWLLFIWFVVNVVVFVVAHRAWLRKANMAIVTARAFAVTLNLNLAAMPFPMLHRVWGLPLAKIKKTWFPTQTMPPIKSVSLHRALFWLIAFGTVFHILGHLAAISVRLERIYLQSAWESGFALTTFIVTLGAFSLAKPSRKRFVKAHVIGGLLVLATLVVHAPSSLVWVAPGCVFVGIERYLAHRNLNKSNRDFHLRSIRRFGDSVMRMEFVRLKPNPSNDQILRGGEYVYICIPVIGASEWRPFSAIPIYDEDFRLYDKIDLFVRIRSDGDYQSWTNRVAHALGPWEMNEFEIACDPTSTLPRIKALIDGPHASPTTRFWDYDRVCLLSTGIGCTPAVSALRAIRRADQSKECKTPSQIIVAWVVNFKELGEFDWMMDELHAAFQELDPREHQFQAHVYVTGCVSANLNNNTKKRFTTTCKETSTLDEFKHAIRNPKHGAQEQSSICKDYTETSSLSDHLFVWRGRPLLPKVLDQFQPSQLSAGVFCCGPNAFVDDAREAVQAMVHDAPQNVGFHFEVF